MLSVVTEGHSMNDDASWWGSSSMVLSLQWDVQSNTWTIAVEIVRWTGIVDPIRSDTRSEPIDLDRRVSVVARSVDGADRESRRGDVGTKRNGLDQSRNASCQHESNWRSAAHDSQRIALNSHSLEKTIGDGAVLVENHRSTSNNTRLEAVLIATNEHNSTSDDR